MNHKQQITKLRVAMRRFEHEIKKLPSDEALGYTEHVLNIIEYWINSRLEVEKEAVENLLNNILKQSQ